MKKTLTLFLLCFFAKALFAQEIIAHYELNGNGTDSGPNDFIAEIYGATPTEDRFGTPNRALAFDGINDYLEIANQSELNFGDSDFAISFWFKTSSTNIQMIVHNGSSGTSPQYWVRLKDYAAGIDLKFLTSNGIPASSIVTYNNPAIFDDNWYHVVVQRVGLIHEIYLDGQLVSSYENEEIKDVSNEDNMLIGAQHPHPSNGLPNIHNFFEGALDDLIFFKNSLSEQQVEDLYNGEFTSTKEEIADAFQIDVFPNPTADILRFNTSGFNVNDAQVSIHDSKGRMLNALNLDRNEIRLGNLAPGMYLLIFNVQGKILSKQFIKL